MPGWSRSLWPLLILLGFAQAQSLYLFSPQGPLRGGVNEALGVGYFLGIPYAKAERWKAPVPAPGWTEVREARHFGNACPQRGVFTTRLGGYLPPKSEDCLNLNVWMPLAAPPAGGWPVLVWIHGGSFSGGGSGEAVYDGSRLAAGGAVVVSLNYRLGPLGWLVLPALRAEDPQGSVGNYGLLDQLEALRWVQRSIRAFGGNPQNVTVFGQSAGGMSVCDLLASPKGQGLIHKAILMSGSCTFVRGLEVDFKFGAEWAQAMGCPQADPACLRQVPLARMYPPEGSVLEGVVQRVESGGFEQSPWKPHLDGVVLDEVPLQALKEGRAAGIPLLAGGTRQELWGELLSAPGDWAGFEERAERVLAGKGQAARALYQGLYTSPREAWAYFQTDRVLLCPSLEAARLQGQWALTYGYLVSYRSPVFPDLGSFHGIELPLLFGTQNTWPAQAIFLTAQAYQESLPISRELQQRWLEFARTGQPGWLPYDSGKVLEVGSGLRVIDNPYDERCGLFR
ncbi:MAG: carboxylesterase [Meiothermus sp.]